MHEEKIHVTTSSHHQFSCSGADTRTLTVTPRIVNVRPFGTEIEPQEIFFRRDMKVALFPEDLEAYFTESLNAIQLLSFPIHLLSFFFRLQLIQRRFYFHST